MSNPKNSKGGRPLKKHGKKDHLVQFLVSGEQFLVLRGLLKTSHYHGMGEMLRAMVFDKKINVLTENANARELQFELSKIGANINQIAKRCNIDSIGGTTSRLHLSDRYVINRASNILEKALKKKVI